MQQFREPMQQFRGSVQLYDGKRLSYLHAPREPNDIVHQKDGQTLDAYERVFTSWHEHKVRDWPATVLPVPPSSVLEIGIYSGGSLAMWKHLWPAAQIVGVDITLGHINESAMQHLQHAGIPVHLIEMPNPRVTDLGYFSMIIDDGAHGAASVLDSFKLCWPMLNSGGVYIVEDWHLAQFDPVKIAGVLGSTVIGTDEGHHFCDGPCPPDSSDHVEVYRRLIAIFKR